MSKKGNKGYMGESDNDQIRARNILGDQIKDQIRTGMNKGIR